MQYLQQQQSNLDCFTDEQKKFILSPQDTWERDIKVNACAGSGKTECILQFVNQVMQKGIDCKQICITTFNVSAINDIHKRAVDLFGEEQANQMEIKNFDKLITKLYEQIKELDSNQLNNQLQEEVDITLVEKQYDLHQMDYGIFCKEAKKIIFGGYKIIIFDEFQDINEYQYEFLLKFKKYGGSYIVAVGDEFQNIYQFRGSDKKFLSSQVSVDIKEINKKLKNKYLDMININLSFNFRSSQEITYFANEIIKCQNQNSNLMRAFQELNSIDDKRQKNIPKLEGYQSYKEQFESIVVSINSYVDQGYSYSDIAIISPIQHSLKQIEYLIEEQNYKINKYPNRYQDKKVIPYYSVIGGSSNFDYNHQVKQKNKVCLSTVHKAKGLEWKIVFFIGLNDDVIPMSFLRQGNFQQKMEEMRRLFYVGCTRSAEILRLFYFCNNNRKASRLFNGINQESFIKSIDVLIEENNENFYQKEFSQSQNYRLSDFFDNLSNVQYIHDLKNSQKYIKDIRITMREVYNKQKMLSDQQIKQIFQEQQQNMLFPYIQIMLLRLILEKINKEQFQITKKDYYLQAIKQKNLEEFSYLQNMLKSFEDQQLSLEENQQQLYRAIYGACVFMQVKKSKQYKYIFNQDPFFEQENIKGCLLKILDTCFKQEDYQQLQIYDEISYKQFYEYETLFTNDTIFEIIQSFEQLTVGKQAMLTVLGKISILKQKYNKDIKNILFYNPIQGTAVKYSLSNWNYHEEFISFMDNIIKKQNEFNYPSQQSSSQSLPASLQNIEDQNSQQIKINENQINQEQQSLQFDQKNIDLEQSQISQNSNQKKKSLLHAAPQQQEPIPKKRFNTENQLIYQYQ
ncbi:hypothetical protein ABPG74_002837 [Tetrahymena malaccensis]